MTKEGKMAETILITGAGSGIGRETARLFLVAISVFFPIYINTYHGVRSVDPQLIEMGQLAQSSLSLPVSITMRSWST